MNIPGQEDALTWVVLIIGIVLFPALAYATVTLWNAANPVPEIPVHRSTGTPREDRTRNTPGTVFFGIHVEDPTIPIRPGGI